MHDDVNRALHKSEVPQYSKDCLVLHIRNFHNFRTAFAHLRRRAISFDARQRLPWNEKSRAENDGTHLQLDSKQPHDAPVNVINRHYDVPQHMFTTHSRATASFAGDPLFRRTLLAQRWYPLFLLHQWNLIIEELEHVHERSHWGSGMGIFSTQIFWKRATSNVSRV